MLVTQNDIKNKRDKESEDQNQKFLNARRDQKSRGFPQGNQKSEVRFKDSSVQKNQQNSYVSNLSLREKTGNLVRKFADVLTKSRTAPESKMLSQGRRSDDSAFSVTVIPYNPDELISKKGYATIDKMRSDDQVRSVITMKKFARLAPGWELVEASSSKSDIAARDFTEWNLNHLVGTFESYLLQTMTAIDYGFSVSEINWEVLKDPGNKYNRKWITRSIKPRRPHNFDFYQDDHGNLLDDGIAQTQLSGEIERMPSNKFIVYTYQKEFDNLYGSSDYKAFYREWWIKTVILKFYAMWLERFPFPPTIGWYPPGTASKSIDELESVLEALQVSTTATLPMGINIDQLEVPVSGARVYETAIKIMNKAITRGALVPDLLGFTDTSTRGSFALGQKHFDVFLWILVELGKDLSTVLNEQLIPQLTGFNFDASPPIFKLKSPVDETSSRAEVLKILIQGGVVDPKEEWVRDYVNVPKSDEPFVRKFMMNHRESLTKKESVEDEDESEELETEVSETFVSEKSKQLNCFDDFSFLNDVRLLTAYESATRIDFQELLIKWHRWEKETSIAVADILFDEIGKMLPKIERIYESENTRALRQLTINVGAVRDEIFSRFLDAYMSAKLDTLKEVQNSLDSSSNGEIIKFNNEDEISNNGLLNLQEPPKPEEIIKKFRGKIPLTKKEWSRLKQRYRTRAFTIAGQLNRSIVSDFQEIVFKALDEDFTLTELLTQVEAKGMTYTGRAWNFPPGTPITPWHTELVFRNSFAAVYNEGRRALFNNASVSKFVPALQYSAIIDTRVRATHASMDNRIYEKGDPIWKIWYPPNGHACFVEGTMITLRGSRRKPIEKVKIGDFVYTHKGNWKQVIQLHKNWHDEEMIEITTSSGFVINCTSNHPILVEGKVWKRSEDWKWKNAEDLTLKDRVITMHAVKAIKQWEGNDERRKRVSIWCKENDFGGSRRGKIFVPESYHPCENCGKITSYYKFCCKKCVIESGVLSFPLEKNPAWQGGLSFLPYPIEFNERLKKRIRKRDKVSCQMCGEPRGEGIKVVHHIDADKFNNEDDNLITLCRSCHGRIRIKDYHQRKQLRFTAWLNGMAESIKINPGIKKYMYKGFVYNLSVEDDESYSANSIIAHNCRCIVIPVTSNMDFSLSEPTSLKPDSGFGV